MKIIYQLIRFTFIVVIIMLTSSYLILQKRVFLEKFLIGKFSYKMFKEEKFLHDDKMQAEYFCLYSEENKLLCSSYRLGKRNDSVFIKGKYFIKKRGIDFHEYYFYHNNSMPDSVIKMVYQNKTGNLILLKILEYKNGHETITKF